MTPVDHGFDSKDSQAHRVSEPSITCLARDGFAEDPAVAGHHGGARIVAGALDAQDQLWSPNHHLFGKSGCRDRQCPCAWSARYRT